MVAASMPVLATDRMRYVGEPIATVIAETLAQPRRPRKRSQWTSGDLGSAPDIEHATAE